MIIFYVKWVCKLTCRFPKMGQTQQRNVYYNWWMQETNHLGRIEKSCINIHVRYIKSESDNGHGIPTLILGQEEMMVDIVRTQS